MNKKILYKIFPRDPKLGLCLDKMSVPAYILQYSFYVGLMWLAWMILSIMILFSNLKEGVSKWAKESK